MGKLRRIGKVHGITFTVMILLWSQPLLADSPPETGGKTALLIIDIQEFYFPGGAIPLVGPESAAENTKKLLEKFRDDGNFVVHVGHITSAGADFHADVAPLQGEPVFKKSEVSAFNGTDLHEYLQEKDVAKLVICGMQTHMCVEGAVRAAYDLGYECVLVQDACATRDLDYEGTIIDAAAVHQSTLKTLDGIYARVVDTESILRSPSAGR